jgi:arylsulfatase A-like enzyme
LTESIDIAATVLDLANIIPQWTHFGRSLRPQLKGDLGKKNRDYVVCEGGYDTAEPHCIEGAEIHGGIKGKPKRKIQQEFPSSVCRTVMIRSAYDKFVLRSSGSEEYFDLRRDPQELGTGKVHPDNSDRKRELKNELLSIYLRTSDISPFTPDPRHIVPEI